MRAAVLSAGAIVGVTRVAKGPARSEPTPLGSVAALRAEAPTDRLWQQAKAYGTQQQRAETRAAAAAQAEADRVAAEQAAGEQAAAEAAAEAARREGGPSQARRRPARQRRPIEEGPACASQFVF